MLNRLLSLTLALAVSVAALDAALAASVGGNIAPDGTAAHLDLPQHQHLRNKAGSDGAGLCVFTSVEHSARWQNVPQLIGFRDWMTRYPGGGRPEKVTAKIREICRERGMPEPKYLQYVGKDLEIIKLACQTGRMPAVTYRFSPTGRYGGKQIWHMVTVVHADDKNFGILDNNYPGTIEWMTPAEFSRVFIEGGGWMVCLLDPGPPPPPKN